MFSVSVKTKYGLSALFKLAQHYDDAPMQIRQIATECQIPHNYLEQVLADLKRQGFLTSYRGAQGGYRLAKDPSDITVKDIVTCLEGSARLSDENCGSTCLKDFWSTVDEALLQALDKSILTLVQEEQRAKKSFVYSI